MGSRSDASFARVSKRHIQMTAIGETCTIKWKKCFSIPKKVSVPQIDQRSVINWNWPRGRNLFTKCETFQRVWPWSCKKSWARRVHRSWNETLLSFSKASRLRRILWRSLITKYYRKSYSVIAVRSAVLIRYKPKVVQSPIVGLLN